MSINTIFWSAIANVININAKITIRIMIIISNPKKIKLNSCPLILISYCFFILLNLNHFLTVNYKCFLFYCYLAMRVFFFFYFKKTCASNYLTSIQVNSVHENKLKHKLLSYYILFNLIFLLLNS